MNFSKLYNEIAPKSIGFLAVFFLVMCIGYGILYLIDFVPEKPTSKAETDTEVVTEDTPEIIPENQTTSDVAESNLNFDPSIDPLPVSITIDRLEKTITILNPVSRDITDLDQALLTGVVRHPDSADLSQKDGNILILGHSSYLKTVFNKNYQAFNGIQNLTWGDTIRLRSKDTEYIYKVDKVYQAKASTVSVPTKTNGGQKLTLATCDTFGAKEDRFIVEASLVSKKAL